MSIQPRERISLYHLVVLLLIINIIHIIYLNLKENVLKNPCSSGRIYPYKSNDYSKLIFDYCTKTSFPDNFLKKKINNSYKNVFFMSIIVVGIIIIILGISGGLEYLFYSSAPKLGKNYFFKYIDIKFIISSLVDSFQGSGATGVKTLISWLVGIGLGFTLIYFLGFEITYDSKLVDNESLNLFTVYFFILTITIFTLIIAIPNIMNKSSSTIIFYIVTYLFLIISCYLQIQNINMINDIRQGGYSCNLNVESQIIKNTLTLKNKCVIDNSNHSLLFGLNITFVILCSLFMFYFIYKLVK